MFNGDDQLYLPVFLVRREKCPGVHGVRLRVLVHRTRLVWLGGTANILQFRVHECRLRTTAAVLNHDVALPEESLGDVKAEQRFLCVLISVDL